MAHILLVHEGVDELIRYLRTGTANIAQELATLDASLYRLHSEWSGEARDAHQHAHSEWRRDIHGMLEALAAGTHIVAGTLEEHARLEDHNAARWAF